MAGEHERFEEVLALAAAELRCRSALVDHFFRSLFGGNMPSSLGDVASCSRGQSYETRKTILANAVG